MENKALWITLGIIGLAIVGYFAYTTGDQQMQPTSTTQQFPTTSQETPTTTTDDVPDSLTIVMTNNSFEPSNINIQEGETITWENEDPVLHTVTIEELNIDEDVEAGSDFSYTFEEPGTYDLNCNIHAGMEGEITVESDSSMEVETDTETDINVDQNSENGLY